MTVLGGLQSAVAAVKAKKAAGFNTDDGIRRATILRRSSSVAEVISVSIPMTVLGGLQYLFLLV